MNKSFIHSLKFKLVLLVSLVLIGIPWSGYYLVTEMEEILQEQQERTLISQAKTVQQIMLGSDFKFRRHRKGDLFEHEWNKPIEIDGERNEWIDLAAHFERVTDPKSNFSFQVAAGKSEGRFVVLLNTYSPEMDPWSGRDFVVMYLGDRTYYKFDIYRPGYVKAQIWNEELQEFQSGIYTAGISAAWQQNEGGYQLEVSFPESKVQEIFGVRVHTTGNRKLTNVQPRPIETGRLIKPIVEFSDLAKKFAADTMRIRIFDHLGWRLADVNEMPKYKDSVSGWGWVVREFIRLVMPYREYKSYPFDSVDTQLLYEKSDFTDKGYDFTRWRSELNGRVIASVAVPLLRNVGGAEILVGTIYVEQSAEDILYFQDRALKNILQVTVLLFIVMSAVLLGFASFLASKIRTLKHGLETSVSHDGRIIGEMKPSSSKDEIGELSRGVDSVLKRLKEYNHYLEAMASRLAHELRTPLAVVKTSIENAKLNSTEEQAKYLSRAESGAERLDNILSRLREATRLEQSLKDAEIVSFDIVDLINSQVDGYREIWPKISFVVDSEEEVMSIIGAPEIVVQAIDKLISNAIDFHEINTPVLINVAKDKKYLKIGVVNQGEALPEQDIFESMVSKRMNSDGQPHLGIGLYIVKLVAEFHNGQVQAKNIEESLVQVGFSIRLQD